MQAVPSRHHAMERGGCVRTRPGVLRPRLSPLLLPTGGRLLLWGPQVRGECPKCVGPQPQSALPNPAPAQVLTPLPLAGISKNRWIHHTSFLWDMHPDNMDCLTLPPNMPAYRESRGHEEFLTLLKDHVSTPDAFLESLPGALQDNFMLQNSSWEAFQAEAATPGKDTRIATVPVSLAGLRQDGTAEQR